MSFAVDIEDANRVNGQWSTKLKQQMLIYERSLRVYHQSLKWKAQGELLTSFPGSHVLATEVQSRVPRSLLLFATITSLTKFEATLI